MVEVNEKNKAKIIKRGMLISYIVLMLSSIALLLMIFLPFASATTEYATRLEKYPDYMVYKEANLTNQDVVNVSMFEFAKVYLATASSDNERTISIIFVVLIVTFVVFAFLTLLFSILKKPIVTMIFDLFSMIVLSLQVWDLSDRKVVPSNFYNWGFAMYLSYIIIAAIITAAIFLLVFKIKNKNYKKLNLDNVN